MALLLSRRQAPKFKWRPETFQQGASFTLPAPYGGLNLRDDITALKPNEARVLENWLPTTGQLSFRDGHSAHAAGLGSGEVKTLAAFIGFSANALLAGADGKIFDVTSSTTDATDGNDQYTKVLLHFPGADASTTITDSNLGGSSHSWTAAGGAQIDTAISKFGGSALLCDGTGDYVTTSDSADFTLGSSDFTIDFWFNRAGGDGTSRNVAGQADSSNTTTTRSFSVRLSTTNVIVAQVNVGATTFAVTGTTTFTASGWHHVAFVRTGSTLKLFVDGVQEGGDVSITGSVNDATNDLSVGRNGEVVANTWNGSIDEFRMSVGIARWTANFTPPTSAYGETILASGFTQDRWQTALYSDRLFFVNGVDTPQVYDGSTVGNIAWAGSGLTNTNLINIALVRNRLWFAEKDQAWVWYANIGQITAASNLTKFDLSQIAGGGFCMAIGSWSITDAGDGADDLTVFVMSTGEIIVYQGDPATTFSLVGKYMGAPPIGRQCLCKVGGELVIITRQGFLPVSAAVRQSPGKALDFSGIDPWGLVAPGVALDAALDASNGGWHGVLHLGLFYGNVPQTEGSLSKQWVLNTRTGAWTNFTNYNASCFASFGSDLYFGAMTGGRVMKVGGSSDNGDPIVAVANGAFKYPRRAEYGNTYTLARPIIQAGGLVSGIIGVDTDFIIRSLSGSSVDLAETIGGTPWGSPWGSEWSTSSDPVMQWFSIQGEGAAVSVKLRAQASTSDVKWFSTDLLYKPGGLRAA